MSKIDLSSFSSYEQKIRKRWRLIFLLLNLPLILFNLTLLILPFTGEKMTVEEWVPAVFGLAIYDSLSYAFYYWSYKKAGTGWLLFFLCTSPPSILFLLIFFLAANNLLLVAIASVPLLIYISFYYYCWQLRKINKKFKENNFPEGYIEELKELKGCENVEQMNSRYYNLIQKWPQFEKKTSSQYKTFLSELEA